MEVLKIGNKVDGIIRATYAGEIGSHTIQYDNQPYTIFTGSDVTLSFSSRDVKATHLNFNDLSYNTDTVSEIRIQNVQLTSKILDLICAKYDQPLASGFENYTSSEDGIIYLNKNEAWYQVFVFNSDGELETAYEELNEDQSTIEVNNENSSYLIVYYWLKDKAYSLEQPENKYFNLDLKITGNQDDATKDVYLHFTKCGLRIDRNMFFNSAIQTVNLVFYPLKDGEHFIAI